MDSNLKAKNDLTLWVACLFAVVMVIVVSFLAGREWEAHLIRCQQIEEIRSQLQKEVLIRYEQDD